ncbi:MAG: sporulation protein [Oscillospiraceae bacterium]|nr:sporulation protein [Oscillospiraceae bacterium]
MKHWTDTVERAAEKLALPADSMAALPRVTLTGRRQLLVEEHRGLAEYRDDCVVLDLGAYRLRVTGGELRLAAMDRDAVLLTGAITALEVL